MPRPDLNLLVTLDVLLAEGSVARAARRLRLSPSAMSRALARLREATGDPLLVRAGRGLVPTPRALELRGRVGQLVQDGEAVLRPAERLDLGRLVRTFTLRTSEGFAENFGPDLIARVGRQAPGVRLRFVQKPDKDSAPLRDGTVDLETGVVGRRPVRRCARRRCSGPSHRRRADGAPAGPGRDHPLPLRDRQAHPRLAAGPRRGADRRGLEAVGAGREIVTIVGGFSTALALARASDLIASVPERHTGTCAPECTAFPFRSPRRRSRSRCSGTRGWTPIRRTAGCAGASGTLA
jgi:DNA-binding transcriptional LysR family regulator